jgi:hypothetical protein
MYTKIEEVAPTYTHRWSSHPGRLGCLLRKACSRALTTLPAGQRTSAVRSKRGRSGAWRHGGQRVWQRRGEGGQRPRAPTPPGGGAGGPAAAPPPPPAHTRDAADCHARDAAAAPVKDRERAGWLVADAEEQLAFAKVRCIQNPPYRGRVAARLVPD